MIFQSWPNSKRAAVIDADELEEQTATGKPFDQIAKHFKLHSSTLREKVRNSESLHDAWKRGKQRAKAARLKA